MDLCFYSTLYYQIQYIVKELDILDSVVLHMTMIPIHPKNERLVRL